MPQDRRHLACPGRWGSRCAAGARPREPVDAPPDAGHGRARDPAWSTRPPPGRPHELVHRVELLLDHWGGRAARGPAPGRARGPRPQGDGDAAAHRRAHRRAARRGRRGGRPPRPGPTRPSWTRRGCRPTPTTAWRRSRRRPALGRARRRPGSTTPADGSGRHPGAGQDRQRAGPGPRPPLAAPTPAGRRSPRWPRSTRAPCSPPAPGVPSLVARAPWLPAAPAAAPRRRRRLDRRGGRGRSGCSGSGAGRARPRPARRRAGGRRGEPSTPLLPPPVDHVLLQADLTAVAPGPLEDDLARDLAGAGPGRVARRRDRLPLHRALGPARLRRSAGRRSRCTRRSAGPPAPRCPSRLRYLVDDVARTFGTVRVGAVEAFLRSDDEAALAALRARPARRVAAAAPDRADRARQRHPGRRAAAAAA